MFMKHAISRFFRFFLVAALVAAMAGSLLPSKAFAEAAITATPSTHAVGEAIEWTIQLTGIPLLTDINTTADPAIDPSQITLTFNNITVNGVPGTAANTNSVDKITVAVGAGDAEDLDVAHTVSGQDIVFDTPVAAAANQTVTIKIKSHYTDDAATQDDDESAVAITQHQANPAAASVTVTVDDIDATATVDDETATSSTFETTYRAAGAPTELRVGQSAQWELRIAGLTGPTTPTDPAHPKDVTANTDKITVTFSAGSVASSIDRNDIIVRSSDTNLANDNVNPDGSSVLTIAPTVSGKTISFFSPVGIDAYDGDNPGTNDFASVTVIIAAGVVTAPNFAGAMTATVTVGGNVKAVSLPTNAYQYVSFSPPSAPRGATVTVNGGGFAAGTSGSIDLGAKKGVGTYTVDSSGKLSGTFMTTAGTAAGGEVSVTDLGSGTPIKSGKVFDQKASAAPASDQATRGTQISVALNDFPEAGAPVSAKIVNEEADVTPTSLPTGETSGKVMLTVKQSTTPGTKRVSITSGGETATFLITIAGRVLTVTPSSAVPGQAVRISGSGFQGVGSVDLTLSSASDSAPVTDGDGITVNQDGTFLYAGKVPFTDATKSAATALPMTWAAVDASDSGGPAAASSGFTIQSRTVVLSPSMANPGATVDISGAGWGTGARGNVTSHVNIAVTGAGSRGVTAGPFPISSNGEFSGSFTVPGDAGVGKLDVTATDNNSTTGAGGFTSVATKTVKLTVPTGTVSVNPEMASTGSVITITGSGFPAQTNLSRLEFGVANALPVPAPATDLSGNFTVTINVPAATGGGSLPPGAVVIQATVGKISGTASFTIPGPSITLSTSSARAGETITVTGTGFSAFTSVGTVNVGEVNQVPTPNPLTDGVGGFTANVVVPALNPGAYTLTVRAGTGFTATAPITVLPATTGRVVSAEIAFQALTSRGILSLAAAAPPGGTSFGAYVPDLAGNTLVNVVPNGVLVLTLNADARISVSGQPAVDVSADTPTFFALGSTVSVEVIE